MNPTDDRPPVDDPSAAPRRASPERPESPWSLRIARVGGVPIRVHVTFWLLLIYLWWAASRMGQSPLLQVALVLGIFACIVAHELAHVLTARRFGIPTRDITLYPIGGVSRMESMGEPKQELLISLAGPLTSFAIGGLLWGGLVAAGPGLRWDAVAAGTATPVEWLAAANFILGVFNLLPAFPMDGGRVLRALLALRLGKDRGTRIAAAIGQGFAVLLGIAGFVNWNVILMLVAVFLFMGARGEAAVQSLLTLARGRRVRDAMITEFESLATDETVGAAAERLVRTEHAVFPVVSAGGRLEGFLTPASIVQSLGKDGGSAPVTAAAHPPRRTLSPDDDLGEVIRQMGSDSQRRPAAVTEGDRLVGILTWENLMEFLAVVQSADAGSGDVSRYRFRPSLSGN